MPPGLLSAGGSPAQPQPQPQQPEQSANGVGRPRGNAPSSRAASRPPSGAALGAANGAAPPVAALPWRQPATPAVQAPAVSAALEGRDVAAGAAWQQEGAGRAAPALHGVAQTAAALAVQLSSLATGALAAAQQQQQQEKRGAATAEASLSAVQQLMAAMAPGMQACSQLLAVAAAEAAAGPPPRTVAEAGCQVGSGGSSSAGVQTEAPPAAAAQVQTLGGSSAALLLEASRGTQTDAGLGPGVGDAWTQTDRPDMVCQCGLCGRSPHNTPGVKLHRCICQAIYCECSSSVCVYDGDVELRAGYAPPALPRCCSRCPATEPRLCLCGWPHLPFRLWAALPGAGLGGAQEVLHYPAPLLAAVVNCRSSLQASW